MRNQSWVPIKSSNSDIEACDGDSQGAVCKTVFEADMDAAFQKGQVPKCNDLIISTLLNHKVKQQMNSKVVTWCVATQLLEIDSIQGKISRGRAE